MATISDSEFRKAQSIALEKLRKKNLMGLLAAQRDGTLQEFVRPELEAYVKRVHPGKLLPENFQRSETSNNEISHRHSEADVTSGNEAIAVANTRKNSLPPSTKFAEVKQTQRASAQPSTQAVKSSTTLESSSMASSPEQTAKQSREPSPIPPPEPTPATVTASSKFQTSKPVGTGLAARMAALNAQNAAPKNPSFVPTHVRSVSSTTTAQPQMKSLGSSSHLARAKRLRSDAEFGEIVNVNMYRPTILQNPSFHRKKTGSRRPSLISDSLVFAFSEEADALDKNSGQSRRKSLQSMDQNTILECSSSSRSVVVDSAVESPSTKIPFSSNANQESASEVNVSETLNPATVVKETNVEMISESESKDRLDNHEKETSTALQNQSPVDPSANGSPAPESQSQSNESREAETKAPMVSVMQENDGSNQSLHLQEDTKGREVFQNKKLGSPDEIGDKSVDLPKQRPEDAPVDQGEAAKSNEERSDESQQKTEDALPDSKETVTDENASKEIFKSQSPTGTVISSQAHRSNDIEPTKSPLHQSSSSVSNVEVSTSDPSPSAPPLSAQKNPESTNGDEPMKATEASCHSPIHQTSSSADASNSNQTTPPSSPSSSSPQKTDSTSCCTIS
jgi:hypothetical protein